MVGKNTGGTFLRVSRCSVESKTRRGLDSSVAVVRDGQGSATAAHAIEIKQGLSTICLQPLQRLFLFVGLFLAGRFFFHLFGDRV